MNPEVELEQQASGCSPGPIIPFSKPAGADGLLD